MSTTVEDKKKRGFRSFFKKKKLEETGAKTAGVAAAKATEFKTPAKPAARSVAEADATPKISNVKPKADDTTDTKGSWLSRTKYFRKLSNWAFDVVDTDGSGSVDEKELYAGLLLIHLKLGSYAGPAACKPVQRDRVHEIFLKRDLDHSGALDREEFAAVMQVLCGNIFTRVLVQWSLTLMIVPMIAKLILDLITWFFGFVCEQISSLENYDDLETTVSSQVDTIGDWIATTFPALTFAIAAVGDKFSALIDIVPDSIWNTIPVTLVSCMLSIILVPYIIFKIDDFFQALADHKKEEKGQGVATSSS